MIKTRLSILLFATTATVATAQQEQQYTQFMFNKMAWNPGFAGSYESPTLTAVYRGQWMGLEGAPQTQVVSYNQPLLGNRVGIGGNIAHRTIGINRTLSVDAAYSYRVALRQGTLGIGIQASIRNFRQNWLDPRLKGSQDVGSDQAIPGETTSKTVPNFGLGLFYHAEKYFWGVSVPRLVGSNLDFAEQGSVLSREVQHLFVSGGWIFKPSEGIEVVPQILVKYAKAAPLDVDLNCNIFFQQKFLTGLSYRTGAGSSALGESLDMLFGLQANRKWYFGLSYDIGLTRLRKFNAGSVEALMRFYLNPPDVGDFDPPTF